MMEKKGREALQAVRRGELLRKPEPQLSVPSVALVPGKSTLTTSYAAGAPVLGVAAQLVRSMNSVRIDLQHLEAANRSRNLSQALQALCAVARFVKYAPELAMQLPRGADPDLMDRVCEMLARAEMAIEDAPKISRAALDAARRGDFTQWDADIAPWRSAHPSKSTLNPEPVRIAKSELRSGVPTEAHSKEPHSSGSLVPMAEPLVETSRPAALAPTTPTRPVPLASAVSGLLRAKTKHAESVPLVDAVGAAPQIVSDEDSREVNDGGIEHGAFAANPVHIPAARLARGTTPGHEATTRDLKETLDPPPSSESSPGRRTLTDDMVGPSRSEPGQRTSTDAMWSSGPTLRFGEFQATAMRHVLSRVGRHHRLAEATLAAASPDVAARVAESAPSQPRAKRARHVTPQGQAMWGAAQAHAVTLYRRAVAGGSPTRETPEVAAAFDALGSGVPLPAAVRQLLEDRLSTSLEGVRLHTEAVAREVAGAIDAEAFTVGEDIFFPGFDPASSRSIETLAHECVHVMQFQQGRTPTALTAPMISKPGDPLEQEAESVVARAFRTSIHVDRDRPHRDPGKAPSLEAAHGGSRFIELIAGPNVGPPTRSQANYSGGSGRAAPFVQLKRASSSAQGKSSPAKQSSPSALSGYEELLLEALTRGDAPVSEFENYARQMDEQDLRVLWQRLSVTPAPANDRLATAFSQAVPESDRKRITGWISQTVKGYETDRRFMALAPGENSVAVELISRIDAPKGVYLRSQPAGGKDGVLLPFGTLVSASRKTDKGWYYVTVLPDHFVEGAEPSAVPAGASGFIESYHVASSMPEPTARLHLVGTGEHLKDIAAQYYKHGFAWGHDARVFVQAIYHANKDRAAVFRQKVDLTVSEEALHTKSLDRALELWGQARVVSGQALWMPSHAFVDQLKATGLIHQASISKTAWDSTVGAASDAWDFVKYAAGFAVGILEGAWGALEDLFRGAVDLVKMVWTAIKDIFNDFAAIKALGKQIAEAWKNRDAIILKIASEFTDKWEQPGDYARGNFQGDFLGYVMMTAFITLVTMGAGAAAAGAGRFGSFIRLIRFADEIGSVGTYVAKLKSKVRLPKGVVDKARAALGKATHIHAGGKRPRNQQQVLEVFTGPDLQSAEHLATQHPNARMYAAEARTPPSPEKIAKFRAMGGEFLQERFAESLSPGSLKKIYVRYPIPHDKGLENVVAEFEDQLKRIMTENPSMSAFEAPIRAMEVLRDNIESMTNLGPRALEKLAPGATIDVVFWEKAIVGELNELTRHRYIDPKTGHMFRLEFASGPTTVPRSVAPHSGHGIPSEVVSVTQVVLRKVVGQ